MDYSLFLRLILFYHVIICYTMFKNYLKTAFRNLLKNKAFTFLNIAGLALGLMAFFLIVLYIVDERGYDTYNFKANRIYRVNTDLKLPTATSLFAITAPAVGIAIKDNFPEVESTVRLLTTKDFRFKKGDEYGQEERGAYCDPGIFDVFTLPMIAGDAATALKEPASIVITESTAKKYFNKTDVVGQLLTLTGDDDRAKNYKISGVIRNIPEQSHFHFDFFLSMTAMPVSKNPNFAALYPFNTYLLLKPEASYTKLQAKFPAFMRKYLGSGPNAWDMDAFEKSGNYFRISLIPLLDIHLQSNRTNEFEANGNAQYLRIFSVIALFILLMACINFMNLSTARSASRAREVGVRKVLGSPRIYLIVQFLAESFLITCAAGIIAILSAWALLPFFNQVSGKELRVTMSMATWLPPGLFFIITIISLLAGSYPAFFLSAFQPVNVLKGKLSTGFRGGRLRSFLVVFQFSISVFLITGTLVMYHQLHYIQSKDPGFNRNQVLVVKNMNALHQPVLFKNEVKRLSDVMNATLTGYSPTGGSRWHNFGSTGTGAAIQTEFWSVDEDYLNTMGMHLLKGRSFLNQLASDSTGIILNETAAKMFGFSNDPLNKEIKYPSYKNAFHVIGVVKDFNFSSMRENIMPLVLVLNKDREGSLHIRINTHDMPRLVHEIEQTWKSLSPGQQFDYSFMDEDFDAIYRSEKHMGQLAIGLTILSVIIACLGLFGLAAFAADQRTKEIGIRKVLGASASRIVVMLSKDFIGLVGIAILIASPIAWFFMQQWLQNFAYRIPMNAWLPAIAGSAAIFISFITISFQSIKAAMTNPVKGLRAE